MRYSKLVESGTSASQFGGYLSDGGPTLITLCVSKDLKDVAAEAARFHGVLGIRSIVHHR